MKFRILTAFLGLFLLASCAQKRSYEPIMPKEGAFASVINTISDDTAPEDTASEEKYMTQAEINEAEWDWMNDYNDEVEEEYQKLMKLLPVYKKELNEEKDIWNKYMEAVGEVAGYEDHGSSTPMYICDILRQGITLRKTSIQGLLLYLEHKEYITSSTLFAPAMISDAYKAFRNAANLFQAVDETEVPKYRNSIRKEEECWNKWLSVRAKISAKLSGEVKERYDDCTNMTIRTKLIQVKNQNQALGATGHEPLDCALPDSCSDKALLDYPGFDVVWAKHLENLDWYPTFE